MISFSEKEYDATSTREFTRLSQQTAWVKHCSKSHQNQDQSFNNWTEAAVYHNWWANKFNTASDCNCLRNTTNLQRQELCCQDWHICHQSETKQTLLVKKPHDTILYNKELKSLCYLTAQWIQLTVDTSAQTEAHYWHERISHQHSVPSCLC